MTRTEEAVAKLAAVWEAVASLPKVRRAEQLPGKFEADGSGAGRYLNIRKGTTDRSDLLGTGEPGGRIYELDHDVEVEWLVEHRNRATRSAAFEAGLIAMDDALQADPTLGEVVSNAEFQRVEFGGLATDGIAEIEACIATVRLTFTSDRPF